MNSGFNKNETEFGVFVLAITLEMLADSDGLLLLAEDFHLLRMATRRVAEIKC